MIRSFRCRQTERLFNLEHVLEFTSIERPARRKLEMLNAAGRLEDLRSPPGNHLEKLGGDRSGKYSMRINDQWRICFVWSEGDACEAEIVDYH